VGCECSFVSCWSAGKWWGTGEYFNIPDCIRFATWNIGTVTCKSAEVEETLHRQKIDICYVQETRWRGSSARVMGNGMSWNRFF